MQHSKALLVVCFILSICLSSSQFVNGDAGIRFVNYALNKTDEILGDLTLKTLNDDKVLFNKIPYGTGSPSSEYLPLVAGTHDLRVYYNGIEIASLVLVALDKNNYNVFATGMSVFLQGASDDNPYVANITHTAYISSAAVSDSVLLEGANLTASNYKMYMSIGYFTTSAAQARWLYISYWTDFPAGDYMNITAYNNTPIHIRGPIATARGDPNNPEKSYSLSSPLANIIAPYNDTASHCLRTSQCMTVYTPDTRLDSTPLSSEKYYVEVASYNTSGVTIDSMALRGFITASQAMKIVGDRRTLTSAGRAVIRIAHMAVELGAITVYMNQVSETPYITQIDRFKVFESSALSGTYKIIITHAGELVPLNISGIVGKSYTVSTNGEYLITIYRNSTGHLNSAVFVGSQGTNAGTTLQASVMVVLLSALFALFFRL